MASRTAYSTWTPQKPTLFDGHYLRNRSTLDIGVLGYIGIVQHKEHSPEVLSISPGTLCIPTLPTFLFCLYTTVTLHTAPQNLACCKLCSEVCCSYNTAGHLLQRDMAIQLLLLQQHFIVGFLLVSS